MREYHYTPLSQIDYIPTKGYLIVDDHMFRIRRKTIVDIWELSGTTLNEKIRDGREQAEICGGERIYVDDCHVFSTSVLLDEEQLISNIEAYHTPY